MNDDELRRACVVTRQRMNRCVDLDGTIDVLMAFAKRMQAAGVRMVITESGPYDNVNDLIAWCEAEATRLEQP